MIPPDGTTPAGAPTVNGHSSRQSNVAGDSTSPTLRHRSSHRDARARQRRNQARPTTADSTVPPATGRACHTSRWRRSSSGQRARIRSAAMKKAAPPIRAPALAGASGAPRRTAISNAHQGSAASPTVLAAHPSPVAMNWLTATSPRIGWRNQSMAATSTRPKGATARAGGRRDRGSPPPRQASLPPRLPRRAGRSRGDKPDRELLREVWPHPGQADHSADHCGQGEPEPKRAPGAQRRAPEQPPPAAAGPAPAGWASEPVRASCYPPRMALSALLPR